MKNVLTANYNSDLFITLIESVLYRITKSSPIQIIGSTTGLIDCYAPNSLLQSCGHICGTFQFSGGCL